MSGKGSGKSQVDVDGKEMSGWVFGVTTDRFDSNSNPELLSVKTTTTLVNR